MQTHYFILACHHSMRLQKATKQIARSGNVLLGLQSFISTTVTESGGQGASEADDEKEISSRHTKAAPGLLLLFIYDHALIGIHIRYLLLVENR